VKPYKRSERVREEIRRIIAETIAFEAKDPRLRRITILRVEMSEDLRYARIYYTSYEDVEGLPGMLQKAKGFLRTSLAKKLRMKFTPDLSFHEVKNMDVGIDGWIPEPE